MKITNKRETIQAIKMRNRYVIVGAGNYGKELHNTLSEIKMEPLFFMDNDEKKQGNKVDDVLIIKPQKLEVDCLYIICVVNSIIQEKLHKQLVEFGINEEDILVWKKINRTYEYMSGLTEDEQKIELENMYYELFCKEIDWDSPKSYNEKLNWEKFYARDERKTNLVDKYLVRDWIKEKIGEDYLTHIYGVWDSAENINFDELPEQFVLKVNNGSARNIIVTDKSQINEDEIRKQLEIWKNRNHYYTSFEYQYKNVVPRIICEEYLEGVAENLYDYDVYCFHGEPKFIWCINGSHRESCKAAFYDLDWNKQPFSYGYPMDENLAPKPANLDKIVELSRLLSQDFKHARIDWYQYPKSMHGILFSEITFTTWSGLNHFRPMEYDRILGDMI